MKTNKTLVWKANLPALFKEIASNNEMWILRHPLQITSSILAEVAHRAAELNDDKLNALMCRLSLYEIADQYSEGKDLSRVAKILAKVGWE